MSTFKTDWSLTRPEALVTNSSHTTLDGYDLNNRTLRPNQTLYSRETSNTSLASYLDELSPANLSQADFQPSTSIPHNDQMFRHIVAELQTAASSEIVAPVPDNTNNAQFTHHGTTLAHSHTRASLPPSLHNTTYYSMKPPVHVPEKRVVFQPSKVTKRASHSTLQPPVVVAQESRQYTTFYSPAANDQLHGGSLAIFENVGRRRPKELPRPYVCPEGACTMRYQWWRSLQHHIAAKHKLAKKKADYPQFANLRT